ncbi:ParB/RepB/Spo0J family partition protein [Paraburkholderia unamae]|uniref:ParB/RepB/Spo0J family partition protein n=1 Tax=Paraburkholderia unamae TaxID=219649 RepID=A0ACC6RXN3_9BURK
MPAVSTAAHTATTPIAATETAGRIEYVPLKQLTLSPHNVRKTELTEIPGLAENIAAQGVNQNLVVHRIAGKRGKNAPLGVCAGQRRLAALHLLLEQARITDAYPVPVLVVPEADALLRSLSENEQRKDMHPADKALAFSLLLQEGREAGFIASVFGVSEAAVRRHVKLASLAPKLMDLFRTDEMDWEQATTLVLASDHETQERIWFGAQQSWQRDPYHLREAIIGDEADIRTSDTLRFVTVEAYEAAGGYVRRDLFSGEDAGYIADHELLNRLVADKLEAAANEVRAEGWQWIEVRARGGQSELVFFGQDRPAMRDMTPDEEAARNALAEKLEQTGAALSEYYDSDCEPDEELENSLSDAEDVAKEALEAFDRSMQAWTDAQKQAAGAFVMVGRGGELVVKRGLLRREHSAGSSVAAVSAAQAPKKVKPEHSEALCRRLTAHRTAAVRVELAANPRVAVAVLLHSLIPKVFDGRLGALCYLSALQMDVRPTDDALVRAADDLADSNAWQEIQAQRNKWRNLMPSNPEHLMPWLMEADDDITTGLLAYCVAALVDGVSGTDSPHAINLVSQALELDMTRHWHVTAGGYLNHVSKERIGQAVTEAVDGEAAASLASMKKADAVKAAETRLAGTGWLPSVLRNRDVPAIPHYSACSDEDMDDDAHERAEDEADAAPDSEPVAGSTEPDAEAAATPSEPEDAAMALAA